MSLFRVGSSSFMRRHVYLAFPVALLLSACSSAPPSVKTAPKPVEVITEDDAVPEQTAYSLIDDASRLEQSGASENAIVETLLNATQLFAEQGQCVETRKMLQLLRPELTSALHRARAVISEVQCELQTSQPDYQHVASLLDDIANYGAVLPDIAPLQVRVLINQRRWLEAAELLKLSSDGKYEDALQIWQLVQQLSDADILHASQRNAALRPELELAMLTRRYALEPQVLQSEIDGWRVLYPSHPLQQLPQEVVNALSITPRSPQRIAVLLPLTGRLGNQGQAVRDGILAAYFSTHQNNTSVGSEQTPQIHFFNSALRSAHDLAELVSTYDTIIGPLVRDKISDLLPLLLPEQRFVALNRVEPYMMPESADGVFFALAPEDEAVQLANYIFRQGYTSPVIIAGDGGVPARMVEAFQQTWSALHGRYADKRLTIATFNQNDDMRSTVTSVLDVEQSEQRIRQIENMLSEPLYNVPRNRRDIDAFIVFATPDQTELLNPIIEASLSPFKQEAVPVYATSRSYSQEVSPNTLRDLRNLIFTDMPWMLPDNEQSDLYRLSEDLWPQRNSALKRLFAMGYDALLLTYSSPMLEALPYSTQQGLSGELSIPYQRTIKRTLAMGRITESGVQKVSLNEAQGPTGQ